MNRDWGKNGDLVGVKKEISANMSRRSLLLPILIAVFVMNAGAKTDSWLQVRTPHFVVLSNAGEKQALHVADQFERMRAVFHKRFPRAQVDAASPIIVIALKDKKDFQALEPEAYLAKGQLDLAGLFLRAPDKNYVLLRLDTESEDPYASVYHEYTHFVISRAEEWLPLWLNEGLAEFYQNTEIKGKEVGLGKPSGENILLLRQHQLLPLATLFAVDHNSPYYHEENKGSIFYAQSWALTHYLEIKDIQENTQRLTDYAKLVSNKVDPVAAATQAFGDLSVLEKNLEQYVSHQRFYYLKMPGSTQVDDSTFKVQPVSPTQADTIRADFLAYNQRFKDSRTLLDRLLQEDPKNVAALETMGFLAFREGKLDEAAKWYEQAVKLDSQSFLAHYYFAAIAMQRGQSADRAAQIESSLRIATRLNPSFAPAFDELAGFYGMQHKNFDEASMLNLTAVQLDPGNIGFRLNRANLMLEMERPTDAIAVLRNAMKLAAKPEETAAIQSRLQSIQQYQAERESQERESREATQLSQSSSQSSGREAPPLPDHVDDDRHGAQRTVNGTIKDVHCSYPATMKLKVEVGAKTLNLRAGNYYKVGYSALNFTPTDELNPCKNLEGMKAKVEYFEGLSGAEGQIVSIELSK
jgi:tetratricopeptide (TPR) repeat protein